MRHNYETSPDNPASIRFEMLQTGAYYWFRAEGHDENRVSALNRMRYRQLVERCEAMHIAQPTPEQIYAYAAEKWPAHKLHSWLGGPHT